MFNLSNFQPEGPFANATKYHKTFFDWTDLIRDSQVHLSTVE